LTWPRTLADLVNLALMAVSVAQGVVFVALALLLIALIWWVFQVRRDPEWSLYDAIRVVLLLALLLVVVLAFIPFVRWVRQVTG
jgi:cytochrome bd-type quinol oxidase subunit 2